MESQPRTPGVLTPALFAKGTNMTRLFRICWSLAVLAGFLPFGVSSRADVQLPALFSDHMVLQRDMSAPVWGRAEPGEQVTVEIGGQTKTATADAEGKWSVRLDKLAASEPLTLKVSGKNTLTVNDVLVGEVWLGSGQSNMAMQVSRAKDFEQEKEAANLPQIRMFTVTSGPSTTAQSDCKGVWTVCSPATVGTFSATAYFFGREIHNTLKVPVGLINSSVGGTPIESWISPEAQKASPELQAFFEAQQKADAAFDAEAAKAKYERDLAKHKEAVRKAKAAGQKAPRAPQDPLAVRARKGNIGGLFNGKIAPLIPYAIRGALWYQGEANTAPGKEEFYKHQLPLLVQDWRRRWGAGDFPFAWVQLPNFTRPGTGWPVVREAMLQTLKLPNTGMAITIDIGDPKDIHPTNKQDVGKRLAAWALGTVYGRDVVPSGPIPAGYEVRGSEIIVKFKYAAAGLTGKDGTLRGFEIAGEDRQWFPALARIAGDTVIISHPEVQKPVAVRYAWQDNPDCNLYNSAGLPASPFRTDAGS
jgi:sialate O-acetylesterase